MSATILVIEDDTATLDVEREMLEGDGYRVLTGLGHDAIALAMGEWPDVILLDLMMPGLDGFALREELLRRPETRGIPVIVISALSQSYYNSANMRAHAVIGKPFRMDHFLQAVASALPPAAQEE